MITPFEEQDDIAEQHGAARMLGAVLWIAAWAFCSGAVALVFTTQIRAGLIAYGTGFAMASLILWFRLRQARKADPEVGASARVR